RRRSRWRRRRLVGDVGEGQALELRTDPEVGVARDLGVVEREVVEGAADAKRRVRDRAFAHRGSDVAAHAFGQAERQVACGARGSGVRETSVELELTGI